MTEAPDVAEPALRRGTSPSVGRSGAAPRPGGALAWRTGYALANGIRLHYVTAGAGPLVVLCHGFPEFWYSWRAQVAALATEWRVVAPDLRGYHRSDKPASGYDVKTLTADVAGLVRAFGAEKAVIVGHDMGGLLAWQFALDYPELTRGVASLNTPYRPRPPVPYSRLFARHQTSRYILALQEPGAEAVIQADVPAFVSSVFLGLACNRAAFPRRVLCRYARALAPDGAVAPLLAYYRSFDRNWELTAGDEGRRIGAPVLMIAADADPLFPAAQSATIHRWIPHVRRHVVRACGHWTQHERPAEVTACLRRFLREIDAATGRVAG